MESRDRQHRAQVLFVCECVLFPTALMKHLQSAGPRHAPGHKTVLLLWVPHGRYVAQPAAGVHVVSEKPRLRPIKSRCSGNLQKDIAGEAGGGAYLMDVSRGGLAVLSDVSKILWEEDTHIKLRLKKTSKCKKVFRCSGGHLIRSSIQEVRTRFPVLGEKNALVILKLCPCSSETAMLLDFRYLLS